MLKDLNDVVTFSEEKAQEIPIIASEIILRRDPDLGDDLEKVSRDLGLPPIYKKCVGKIGVFGVSIGGFNLWPGSRRVKNLAEALYQSNGDDDPVGSVARQHHLVYVASDEANWICVGAAGHPGEDVVSFIDTMSAPTPETYAIAPDFEKFLILAANLNQISLANRGDEQKAELLITECCKAASCSADQSEFWKQEAVNLTE